MSDPDCFCPDILSGDCLKIILSLVKANTEKPKRDKYTWLVSRRFRTKNTYKNFNLFTKIYRSLVKTLCCVVFKICLELNFSLLHIIKFLPKKRIC